MKSLLRRLSTSIESHGQARVFLLSPNGTLEIWRTGEPLAKANPEIKPEFLQVGMKIRIPEAMIVNPNAMTQEFVASHYPKDSKRSKSPQSDSADLPLIGPKSYSDK